MIWMKFLSIKLIWWNQFWTTEWILIRVIMTKLFLMKLIFKKLVFIKLILITLIFIQWFFMELTFINSISIKKKFDEIHFDWIDFDEIEFDETILTFSYEHDNSQTIYFQTQLNISELGTGQPQLVLFTGLLCQVISQNANWTSTAVCTRSSPYFAPLPLCWQPSWLLAPGLKKLHCWISHSTHVYPSPCQSHLYSPIPW